MPKSLEEVIGGSLEERRLVPGTRSGESDTVRYVSLGGEWQPIDVYDRIVRDGDAVTPSHGGVFLDASVLAVPDGTTFFPMTFNGDLDGWARHIEVRAERLGLITAKILDSRFVLSDGRTFSLRDCKIEFD